MGDSDSSLILAVDIGIHGLIDLVGVFLRGHHDYIGEDIIAAHHSQLTYRHHIGINHKLLPEELLTVGTLAMTANRKNIEFEELAMLIIFPASHIDFGIEHGGSGMHIQACIAYETGMTAGIDRLRHKLQIGTLLEHDILNHTRIIISHLGKFCGRSGGDPCERILPEGDILLITVAIHIRPSGR